MDSVESAFKKLEATLAVLDKRKQNEIFSAVVDLIESLAMGAINETAPLSKTSMFQPRRSSPIIDKKSEDIKTVVNKIRDTIQAKIDENNKTMK